MAYPLPATSFSDIEIEIEIESPVTPPYDSSSASSSADDFEASTSASTADDINVKSSKYYGYGRDVFINHRGPDVKKTFASHLYHSLLVHGVEAFLDIQGMQEGEDISAQIKDAIATATVHVAIFSPGYAESSWCLDELVDMLKSKAPIIPVFYNVKPGDLRGKDGVYAKAIRELEKKPRHSSDTIENWRKALATVSKISGFELEACNGDEGVLLHKVVELLLKKVKREELYVANYPTGLDEKVRQFERFLSRLPEKETKIAGITGSGGIGKTTLAKELFNRKSSYYRKSCFLSDVRNAAKSGGISLVGLQRKLLQRLFGFNMQIDSIDEGKKKLMERFQHFSHGMLILDDVDHLDQLDALLPGEVKHTFPPNCLILITSRDKYVLLISGIRDASIYKLSGLNTHHSTELFCRHAFCQRHPPPSFQYLVDNILRVCRGLPLSLKVLGGHFRGNRDETYWEAELSRIKYTHHDILQILKISYDSLDEDEKHVFLYISCFLMGERKDTVIKVWDSHVFQNLQYKYLVEVDSESCIDMHDHLRELGREMAKSSGFHIPCLWDRTEKENIASFLQMLMQSANRDVRGIRLVTSAEVGHGLKYYASLQSDIPWFKRRTHKLWGNPVMKLCNSRHRTLYPGITMSNLQLLVTEDDLLERILRTVGLPNLRWLRWYKCGHSSLPSYIPMENLRVLSVAGNALKILWQGKAQAPLQLRELEIWAPLSKLPKSIGQLQHLEQIYICLPSMNNMISLPDEVCRLSSLKRFELLNARKMKSLPDLIGNLTNLEHLNLSFSGSLARLPSSFQKLERLKCLNLTGCYKLFISTKNLGVLPSLDVFNVSLKMRMRRQRLRWESFTRLGREGWMAEREREWEAGWEMAERVWAKAERFGEAGWALVNRVSMAAERLAMSDAALGAACWLVSWVECPTACWLGSWVVECPTGCWLWSWVEWAACWVEWAACWAEWAACWVEWAADCAEWAADCAGWAERWAGEWAAPWAAAWRAGWQAGKWFCNMLGAELAVGERKRLWPWSRLPTDSREAPWHRVMQIARDALARKPFVKEGKEKQTLREDMRQVYQQKWEMKWHSEWEEIRDHVWRCGKFQLLPLQLPLSLQELHIAELPSNIEDLSNLEVLVLECSSLEKLPPSLSDPRNLKKLRLVYCHRLKSLPDSLGLLTELEVKSCYGLVEVGTLPSTLIQLTFISCQNLERINGLCGLAELQTLNLSGLINVKELSGIETLVSLEQLRASGCQRLKRIQGLGQLTKLKLLDVHGCREIVELEGVEHLRSLEMLDASNCPNLLWDGWVLEQLRQRLKEGMLYI